ncbi:MAG: NUDIX domain-containing protein [Bacilli bacterium]|nr:NUDIX domain-containing protein [Bacilli bacterium]
MNKALSYILQLRNALRPELRNMPLFQNGSAIIVVNEKGDILLQHRTDRDLWCVPGGLQELGETFEEVAIRELKEETGLIVNEEDLILIKAVSGESRKNSYPNGDVVYNNTLLYMARKYTGVLGSNYEEIVDRGNGYFESSKESRGLKFFSLDTLPDNLMDQDLIKVYIKRK